MSRKIKILGLVCAVALIVLLARIAFSLNADRPSNADIILKARFISGNTVIGEGQDQISIPNEIENDIPGLYYQNTGNNVIVLHDGALYMTIQTDRRSSRYVNISFDCEVSPPGQNLPSGCVRPYFIYPVVIVPIETTKLRMVCGGEWEMIPDPNDPDWLVMQSKDTGLNFTTMTDEQEAYFYIPWFYFHPSDLKATRYDESRDMYRFADCLWAKVKAWDWDGVKANTWTLTPVTEPFKHKAWDNPNAWCYHPEGAIPYMLFSNSALVCNHGTYRMPWKLEITRR